MSVGRQELPGVRLREKGEPLRSGSLSLAGRLGAGQEFTGDVADLRRLLADKRERAAHGQRRQAEVVTGRRFEAPPGLTPAFSGNVVKFPLTGHQKPHLPPH